MLIRSLENPEQAAYDRVVKHPLQSWAWGDFKKATGHQVERIGFFEGKKLVNGVQVIFTQVPHTKYTIGYCPRGFAPDQHQLQALTEIAQRHNAIYIKLEPNLSVRAQGPDEQQASFDQVKRLIADHGGQPGKAMFTKYTFWLNLSPSLDELSARLNSKTRYNIRLATKKGVQIIEDSSLNGMESYIKLMEETTKRQKFFNHDGAYFRQLHQTLAETGMMHIFHAVYQDQVLTSWITFNFNQVFYYPYGASSNEHREVMPNNLMMWEAIRFGKQEKCQFFDMWGSLGPNPDHSDPWYGFHRFKEGYGGELREYIGTFDLVYNQKLYKMFNFADKWRWRFLKLKSRFTS